MAAAPGARELAENNRANLSRAEASAQEAQARADKIASAELAGQPSDFLTSAAAGAGMGMVFGPVGALIGAGLAHMFNKKQRASIQEYASQDAQSTQASLDRARSAIASAYEQATTDQERAELELMESEFNQYAELTSHPDASVRGQSLLKALEVSGSLDAELDEWQTERLATEERERERLASQFSDFDNVRGDLMRESQNFVRARDAWQGAQALIENPSPTNDIALIYKMANINDPGAIVTEGDVQVLQSTGGINDTMAQLYNSVIKGEAELSDGQRQDLINTIDTLYREQRNGQIDRNAEFQAIGQARGFDQAYQDRLRVPIDPGEASILSRSAPANAGAPGAATPPPQANGQPAELTPVEPGFLARTLESAVDFYGGVAQDVARNAAGETVVQDQDGRYYIRDNQGNLSEPPANFIPPQAPAGPLGVDWGSVLTTNPIGPQSDAEREAIRQQRARDFLRAPMTPGVDGGYIYRDETGRITGTGTTPQRPTN